MTLALTHVPGDRITVAHAGTERSADGAWDRTDVADALERSPW